MAGDGKKEDGKGRGKGSILPFLFYNLTTGLEESTMEELAKIR